MKKIPLSKGKFTTVDDENYECLSRYTWHVKDGYAARSDGNKKILMHRMVMGFPPSAIEIDHIDRNKLNNQEGNLRLVSRSINSQNRGPSIKNSSNYKGVYKYKYGWRASIGFEGERFYLGTFESPEEAALAYDAAVRYLFDDYAFLNFPDIDTPPEIEKWVSMRI